MKPRLLIALGGLVVAADTLAQAGRLNDSGLQVCADNVAVAACTPAGFDGQDAQFGRDHLAAFGQLPKTGAGQAGFDFTKISNAGNDLPASAAFGSNPGDWGCTRDNVSGLVWRAQPGSALTFAAAQSFANSFNSGNGACGRTGWRLPQPIELHGLVHHGLISAPLIDQDYLPFQSATLGMWTNTISTAFTDSAYAVTFGAGVLSIMPMTSNGSARPVTGTLATGTPVLNGDGTLTDPRTLLQFSACPLGQSGTSCMGSPLLLNWQQALDEVRLRNQANFLGHNDWRLPNVKELVSPFDFGQFTTNTNFWSSTTFRQLNSRAEAVDLGFGFAFDLAKDQTARVRLVRGGQPFANAQGILFANGFE